MTTRILPSYFGPATGSYSGCNSTATSRPLRIDPRYMAQSSGTTTAASATFELLSRLDTIQHPSTMTPSQRNAASACVAHTYRSLFDTTDIPSALSQTDHKPDSTTWFQWQSAMSDVNRALTPLTRNRSTRDATRRELDSIISTLFSKTEAAHDSAPDRQQGSPSDMPDTTTPESTLTSWTGTPGTDSLSTQSAVSRGEDALNAISASPAPWQAGRPGRGTTLDSTDTGTRPSALADDTAEPSSDTRRPSYYFDRLTPQARRISRRSDNTTARTPDETASFDSGTEDMSASSRSASQSAYATPYTRTTRSTRNTSTRTRRGALKWTSAYRLDTSRPLTSFQLRLGSDDKARKSKGTSHFLRTKGAEVVNKKFDRKSGIMSVEYKTGSEDECAGSTVLKRYAITGEGDRKRAILLESCRLDSNDEMIPETLFRTRRIPTTAYRSELLGAYRSALSSNGTSHRTRRLTWGRDTVREIPLVGKGRPVKQRG